MKKDAWRIAVFLLAVTCIMIMWVKKDIAGTVSGMEIRDALPVILISVVVTTIKVSVHAILILLLKWIIGKIGGAGNEKQD